jgi:hypothetical protein
MFSQKQGWLNQGLVNSDNFWISTYGSTATPNTHRYSGRSVTDSNGNTYSHGASGNQYIAKINISGNIVWTYLLNVLGGSPTPTNICLDPSESNVYVCGDNSSSGRGPFLMKIGSNGTIAWRRQLRDTSSVYFLNFYNIAVDNLNNVYVVGRTFTSPSDYGFLIAKYDSTGNLLWQKISNLVTSSVNLDNISIDSNNNLCVCGYFDGAQRIIKLDSSGNIIWQNSISNIQGAISNFDSAGNIYITGGTFVPSSSSTCITLKYDSSGNIIWQREYSGSDPSSITAYGRIIKFDSLGNIYVLSGINEAVTVLQYNSSGVLLPIKINLSDSDTRYIMSVDSLNNIYIGLGGLYDNTIIKLSNAGILQGTYRYGRNNDTFITYSLVSFNDVAASCVNSTSSISFSASSYTSSTVSASTSNVASSTWIVTM